MSFKSETHREKFKELLKQGKITQAQYDEKHAATPPGIPARLPKKKR